MAKNKSPSNPSVLPVVYVHAKDREPLNGEQTDALLELGLPLFSRLQIQGTTQTLNGYDQPELLLAELAALFPNRPVIFLRAGLQPSGILLDHLSRIIAQASQPVVISLLSNADPAVNPFVGVTTTSPESEYDLERLVGFLAPGNLHDLTHWVDHFAYFSVDAIDLLKGNAGHGTLIQQLSAAGGKLQVPDHLFLHDPDKRVFEKLVLKPHETACPSPFAELSTRIQDWINTGIPHLPAISPEPGSATLHVTHSWGGGIAQWIESFIATDNGHPHYQLRSEAARSNRIYGQRLCLYIGNQLRHPIASWWLQPPIESVVISDASYQQILSDICNRFDIGRVFISSLIGHSLDALRTGLPTVNILHDHFPIWPLLGVNPEPYLSDKPGLDLERALRDHQKSQNFPDKNAQAWKQVHTSYVEALTEFEVKIAVPGSWVLELQTRLDPVFSGLDSMVIPHGFPALKFTDTIIPRHRQDGRLRMAIIGRMQEGKGRNLLLRSLPLLTKYVHIYLLGSGKAGETFFGISGVDVVPEYDREQLGDLLASIGPDLAALLSVVPETFSYTLSELWQLGIPTVATSIGSFQDRIEHGRTGWLVEPEADALIKQLATLYHEPGQIESVRQNLLETTTDSLANMTRSYNRFCPIKSVAPFVPVNTQHLQVQWGAADFLRTVTDTKLRNAREKQEKLSHELDSRTRWAKHEQRVRKEWVAILQNELKQKQNELKQKQKHHDELQVVLENTITELEDKMIHLGQLESDYQAISDQHAVILQSNSWKITRPFRVIRRMANGFMPNHWPRNVSNSVRSLLTKSTPETPEEPQIPEAKEAADSNSVIAPGPGGKTKLPGPFTVFDHPDASIIIPAYNNWDYTAACLSSLGKASCNSTFEIIVVDDLSTDETANQLGKIKGLIHLRNEENLGFVHNCNLGAKHARGKYLVLLNNDTEVTDGWLDALIDTFDQQDGVGLVGSRLIYPDGKLQESGGIIYNDGSGWNYGRDDHAERPEYQFLREVDYCSGACIALRTAFFTELGGLDERYSPAYYEDTDLAFRVRDSGHKAMVQPHSVVVHHEGITSGTDTSSGTKRFQLINQEKFVARWKANLESQPQAISDPDDRRALRIATRHRNKGQVLFIEASGPETDQHQGSESVRRLLHSCKKMGYGVTLFADAHSYEQTYIRKLQSVGVEVLYPPWLDSPADFFRERRDEFNYVYLSGPEMTTDYVSLIKNHCPHAQIVFDSVELQHLLDQ
jgi:GT2 family glycosyltransferase/glycosyltransferase involved in cell wall biosynthesis